MPRISVGQTKAETPAPPVAEATNKVVDVVPQEPVRTTPEPVTEMASSPLDVELKAKSGKSTLASFSAYPAGVFFSGEEENETIIILLRAHIVTNASWLLVVLGAVLVPLILFPILAIFNIFPSVGAGTEIFMTLLWYAGIFTYGFVNFLYWYFNIYLVTSERVVDIDWYSLLLQKVSSTQISHIEDVTAVRGGVISSLFDFGDIRIQTAGTEEQFEFANIPHPQLVVKKLEELVQDEEKESEPK